MVLQHLYKATRLALRPFEGVCTLFPLKACPHGGFEGVAEAVVFNGRHGCIKSSRLVTGQLLAGRTLRLGGHGGLSALLMLRGIALVPRF